MSLSVQDAVNKTAAVINQNAIQTQQETKKTQESIDSLRKRFVEATVQAMQEITADTNRRMEPIPKISKS